jgi:UDP-4-amino-4,6-dideoxy-N-acetyl-beta-L-altrosamine N-acetyltransferase
MNACPDSFGKLRQIQDNELLTMLAWRNSPSVRANMYTRDVITEEKHLSWWAQVQKSQDKQYFMYEHEGKPTGIVGFTQIDKINSNASWAFYSSPNAKKGAGSRMEYLALEYFFQELKFHKLHCEVLAFNEPVIRLHKKFGFQVEGIFKEHHVIDAGFVDIYRLAIIRDEWAKVSDSIKAKLLRMQGESE